MTTFSDIKSRVSDDLDRTDIPSQIDRELRQAVKHYERQRFWFNEAQVTLTASVGQASYDFPSDYLISDSMEIRRSSGNLVTLNEIPWSRYLDSWRYTSSPGQPIDWAEYTNQYWLGPVPNSEYVHVLSYLKSFVPGSFSDGTENAWTNYAEDLLVARAEKALGAKLLGFNQEQLLIYAALEKSAYDALGALNDQKLMTGTPRPWSG